MRMVMINEHNQTIVPPQPLCTFAPGNEFIANLVREAMSYGTATDYDVSGCPVTATVWDDNTGEVER